MLKLNWGKITLAASTIVAVLIISEASADPLDPNLSGNTQYDEWTNSSLTLTENPGFPGFPGFGAWPGPIDSPLGGPGVDNGDAQLDKVSNGTGGGPYPATGSIYYGGFSSAVNNDGGTLSVSDSSPLANLATIAFGIEIGEAWTFDFYNEVLPSLSYNGGAQNLAPDYSHVEQEFIGTVTMPSGEEPLYNNTYLLGWDVSALGPITDFVIEWTGVQHAALYSLRLDQSDVVQAVEPAAAPEPGFLAMLIGLCPVAMLYLGRRRHATQLVGATA